MLPALLKPISSRVIPWKLIGLGLVMVVALGVWLYVGHLQSENDQLRIDLSSALDAADQNIKALADTKTQHTKVVEAMAAERDAYAMRVKHLSEIRRDIDHAPQSDDGPVAPVLARTLERLRSRAHGAGGPD